MSNMFKTMKSERVGNHSTILWITHLTFGFAFLLIIYSTLMTGQPDDQSEVSLSNEYLSVQFDLSTGQISSFAYQSLVIQTANESSSLFINNLRLDCSQILSYVQDPNSIKFIFSCSNNTNYQLTTIYTLQSGWQFLQKQLDFKNIYSKTITSVETTFTITNMNIPSTSIVFNQQDTDRQHAAFLRTGRASFGLFVTWQHPFGLYSITSNNQTVTSSYNAGIETSYLSEGFLIGFYQLSSYWHTKDINYAERQAYVNATSFFFTVPPRNQSLKHVVGWDNNDYQIDIATEHGVEEYKRLINRCAQLGVTSITFAPSNSNVSRRDQGTDDWGWESILWMSLGEKIRLEQWKPYRDSIPPTVQYLLDYAAIKQVKLVPYVYPSLGYRSSGQDQAWLVENPHCRNVCASFTSVEFQHYFLQLLIDFAQVTGNSSFLGTR